MLSNLISEQWMSEEHCVLVVLIISHGLSHIVDEELGWVDTWCAMTQVDCVILESQLSELHPDCQLVTRLARSDCC